MKKVLIFSASIGGGHNEVAACIENEFTKHGFIVKKSDALMDINKSFDFFISSSYKILIDKFPKVYGNLYYISNKKKANKVITGFISKITNKKFYNIILKENPDLIITTHCFANGIIGYLKEKKYIDIPLISIVTDFKAHQTYIDKNVDAYIISNKSVGDMLALQGISRDRIFPYGIPIKTEFLMNNTAKTEGKKTFQILLMSGSIGCNSMEKILEDILNIKGDYRVVVVCGKNYKLKNFMQNKYIDFIKDKKVIIYGFTNNIPNIMENSDIIITKPGGLTISEAIAKKLPIIIPYYIPGHEKENLDFLVENGLAIYVDELESIEELIEYIMENPYYLENMKQNMTNMCERVNLDNIVYLGESLILDSNFRKVFINGF